MMMFLRPQLAGNGLRQLQGSETRQKWWISGFAYKTCTVIIIFLVCKDRSERETPNCSLVLLPKRPNKSAFEFEIRLRRSVPQLLHWISIWTSHPDLHQNWCNKQSTCFFFQITELPHATFPENQRISPEQMMLGIWKFPSPKMVPFQWKLILGGVAQLHKVATYDPSTPTTEAKLTWVECWCAVGLPATPGGGETKVGGFESNETSQF